MTDKKRSPTVVAATAANRIIELRNAPESIKARFAKREQAVLDKLEPDVQRYVAGILDAHYGTEGQE